MKYQQWLNDVAFSYKASEGRIGRFYYEYLNSTRPDIAARIKDKPGKDPYYADENMNRFLNFVRACWNENSK